MAQTQINGATQIKSGSIPLTALAVGSSIILSTGAVAMGASLNMGGFTVQNSTTPVNATDLTTKAYVDAKTGGIGGIHDVRVVGTANVSSGTLSNSGPSAYVVDGVTLASGDVVLLTNQTTASSNGPWTYNGTSAAFTRPSWWGSGNVVNEGQYFLIAEGTTYKDSKWWCTTTGTITVDTTSTAFTQDLSGTTYSAGTGLSLAGGTFSVNYGTTSTTACAGNDSRLPSSLGAGVNTALGNTANAANGILAANSSGYLATGNMPALTGDVTNTAGSLSTTVNNTKSTGFTKYTNYVVGEVPSGSINGSNTSFTLANTPATCNGGNTSIELFYDGSLLQSGTGNDYTISGSTITMLFTPQTGDKLVANYMM